ncbi:MAG: Hsp20/alpha crystallin family protein [Acidimicrobiales bacterium]
MLMRFDPFRELDRLTQQLLPQGDGALRAMPMDAFRQGDQFVVHFDLPGVDPSSIDLTVEKNVLTVKAERRWIRSPGDEVVVSERQHGRFSRQIFLGETLAASKVEASYDDGVLTLTIPVAEEAKPRRVEVAVGGNGSGRSIPAESTESTESTGPAEPAGVGASS